MGGPSAGRRDAEFGVLSFPLGHRWIYTSFMAMMIQIFFKAPSSDMDLKFYVFLDSVCVELTLISEQCDIYDIY